VGETLRRAKMTDENAQPQPADDPPQYRCGGAIPPSPAAVILAAGQAKRMKSDLVKVLHEVCGRPMLAWVVDACNNAGCTPIYIVVGHQGEQVRKAFEGDPEIRFVEQTERLGTGHAVQQAESMLKDFIGDIIVLAGDGPLIRTETLRTLLQNHRELGAVASLATSVVDDPTGYGRICRNEAGEFSAIVEEKDASKSQREIHEVNPSYYCFDAKTLFEALRKVSNVNASGEYYLTDVLGILHSEGKTIAVFDAVPPEDVLSVNTPEQLSEVSNLLSKRRSARQEAVS